VPIKEIIAKLEVKMVKDNCPYPGNAAGSREVDPKEPPHVCNKWTVLRLMCLLSTTASGIKKEEFDYVRKAFIACYGWDEVATMMNLQDAGILRVSDKKLDFPKVSRIFKLINE